MVWLGSIQQALYRFHFIIVRFGALDGFIGSGAATGEPTPHQSCVEFRLGFVDFVVEWVT